MLLHCRYINYYITDAASRIFLKEKRGNNNGRVHEKRVFKDTDSKYFFQ